MSEAFKIDRARIRAARLRDQALNCLTFAVREADAAQAAELIDEALRRAAITMQTASLPPCS